MQPDVLRALEQRLGPVHARQRLGVEDDRAAFAERRFEKFLERAQAAETAYRTSGPKRTRGV